MSTSAQTLTPINPGEVANAWQTHPSEACIALAGNGSTAMVTHVERAVAVPLFGFPGPVVTLYSEDGDEVRVEDLLASTRDINSGKYEHTLGFMVEGMWRTMGSPFSEAIASLVLHAVMERYGARMNAQAFRSLGLELGLMEVGQ